MTEVLSSGQQIVVAMVAAFGSVVVAILTYLGGRTSAFAQMQNSMTTAFQALTNELQEERELDRRRILHLEGEVAQLQQWALSLEDLLRRNNIPIPERKPVGTVVMIGEHGHHHGRL